jgi:sulfide dehydrogenase cytochrome subunit
MTGSANEETGGVMRQALRTTRSRRALRAHHPPPQSGSGIRFAIAAAVFVAGCAPAFATDAPPGAASCSGCHAPSAALGTPVPPLNGRSAGEIVAQMEAFRRGKTQSTVMDRLAKGFSEAEIQAIAAWYAAQR